MKDQIRAEFEQEFPLPNGVTFDGDHYVADPAVIGAFQNATIWSHMYRGWKRRQETIRVYLPDPGHWSLDRDMVIESIHRAGILAC